MATTLHSIENRPARMLIWNIEIFAQTVFVRDQPDQFVGNHIGITVEKPYPFQTIDLNQLPQQLRDALCQPKVLSVSHRILGNDHKFPDALFCKPPRLRNEICDAAAAEPTAKTRNRAEGAHVIAAFGNLQVRHVGWRREDSRDRWNFLG